MEDTGGGSAEAQRARLVVWTATSLALLTFSLLQVYSTLADTHFFSALHAVLGSPLLRARVVMVVLRHARALQLVASRSLVTLQALQLARLQAGESHGPQHRVSRQREGGHR